VAGLSLCLPAEALAKAGDACPSATKSGGGVMGGTAYNDESRQAQLYKFNDNEVLEGGPLRY